MLKCLGVLRLPKNYLRLLINGGGNTSSYSPKLTLPYPLMQQQCSYGKLQMQQHNSRLFYNNGQLANFFPQNYGNNLAYRELIENAKNNKLTDSVQAAYEQLRKEEEFGMYGDKCSYDDSGKSLEQLLQDYRRQPAYDEYQQHQQPPQQIFQERGIDLHSLRDIFNSKQQLSMEQWKVMVNFLNITDQLNYREIQHAMRYLLQPGASGASLNAENLYVRELLLERSKQLLLRQERKELEEMQLPLPQYGQKCPAEVIANQHCHHSEPILPQFHKIINNAYNKCVRTTMKFAGIESTASPPTSLPATASNSCCCDSVNSGTLHYQKLLLLNSLLRPNLPHHSKHNHSIYRLYTRELQKQLPTLNQQELAREMQQFMSANILAPNQLQVMRDLLQQFGYQQLPNGNANQPCLSPWQQQIVSDSINAVFENCIRLSAYSFGHFNALKPYELSKLLYLELNGSPLMPNELQLLERLCKQFKTAQQTDLADYISLLKQTGLINAENEPLLQRYMRAHGVQWISATSSQTNKNSNYNGEMDYSGATRCQNPEIFEQHQQNQHLPQYYGSADYSAANINSPTNHYEQQQLHQNYVKKLLENELAEEAAYSAAVAANISNQTNQYPQQQHQQQQLHMQQQQQHYVKEHYDNETKEEEEAPTNYQHFFRYNSALNKVHNETSANNQQVNDIEIHLSNKYTNAKSAYNMQNNNERYAAAPEQTTAQQTESQTTSPPTTNNRQNNKKVELNSSSRQHLANNYFSNYYDDDIQNNNFNYGSNYNIKSSNNNSSSSGAPYQHSQNFDFNWQMVNEAVAGIADDIAAATANDSLPNPEQHNLMNNNNYNDTGLLSRAYRNIDMMQQQQELLRATREFLQSYKQQQEQQQRNLHNGLTAYEILALLKNNKFFDFK